MIIYTDSLDTITPEHLKGGFFVGWLKPLSPQMHLRLLQGSAHVWLALDGQRVVGFVTAISDGVLSAYIPLLEVLPEYQGQGIGTQLMTHMLETLSSLYMIDLLCDQPLQPYYARLGMKPAHGMLIRNYHKQSGSAG